MPDLSIILPVLNEAAGLAAALSALAPLRGPGVEVIVVDGGSDDDGPLIAAGLADRVLVAPRGRARQMNAGAAIARGEVLLFLHADTRLPCEAVDEVCRVIGGGQLWGRFDVRIEGASRAFPLIAMMMSLRSRWTGIATGDQAIFVARAVFRAVGGYPDQPLMEDIELSRRLRRLAPPACLCAPVRTSGRRWEAHGVARTVLLMWWLRASYALGADPAKLARRYGYRP